jgi:hypothetical protein
MRMRWTGHEALMEYMRNAQKILTGKPEGTRHLTELIRWGQTVTDTMIQQSCMVIWLFL